VNAVSIFEKGQAAPSLFKLQTKQPLSTSLGQFVFALNPDEMKGIKINTIQLNECETIIKSSFDIVLFQDF
jgi:hypothetical protein